jgi:hypothetical protein
MERKESGMTEIPDDKLHLSLMQEFTTAPYRSDAMPEEGQIVDVVAEDRRGRYALPFPVLFRDDEWINAQSGERLECYISGWRSRS